MNRKTDTWPNLFLCGAPKCGTTAMSHYLSGHPLIFMSEQAGVKEPWYFASDLCSSSHKYKTEEDYLDLYKNAHEGSSYFGDASTSYLYSEVAIPAILGVSADARFIAMVRNPVMLSKALFDQQVMVHLENTYDFIKAWKLQEDRLHGRVSLPAGVDNAKHFQYGSYAKTGFQLQRALHYIDPDRLLIIVYDDFAADPGREYRRVLEFLGLPDDGRSEFPVLNRRKHYRYPLIQSGLFRVAQIRRKLGIPGGWGINALIDRFNTVPLANKEPLQEEFRQELVEYFREDVMLLSDLLHRNLSHWLE